MIMVFFAFILYCLHIVLLLHLDTFGQCYPETFAFLSTFSLFISVLLWIHLAMVRATPGFCLIETGFYVVLTFDVFMHSIFYQVHTRMALPHSGWINKLDVL